MIFVLTISISDFEKKRYDEVINILKNYKESSYGRLAISSIDIFRQNILFGVGIKGYRIECNKLEDTSKDNIHPKCASHPHNFPLELLSETGLVGTVIFIMFYILFLREVFNDHKNHRLNNNLLFSNKSIFLVLPFTYLLPIVPNGSFFTSWNGSFFWFSMGLMLSLTKKNKKNIF